MTQTSTGALLDYEEIRRTWNTLVPPGEIAEVRIVEATVQADQWREYTLYGYFNSADELIRALHDEKLVSFQAAYFTIQRAHPDLIYRVYNKIAIAKKGESTLAKDILRYTWLYIDCDPERISKISATDAQHETALATIRAIDDYLVAQGFPRAVQGDSGNGAALLHRVDLSNNQESRAILESVLYALATRFDTSEITIDQSMADPPQLCRLFGSQNRKGDHTEVRPYRMSRLLYVPDSIETVPLEKLLAVGMPKEKANGAQRNGTNGRSPRAEHDKTVKWLLKWLKKHDLETFVYGPVPTSDGGIKMDVVECFNCGHVDDHKASLFVSANGAIGYHCFHGTCDGIHWSEFREHYESCVENEYSHVPVDELDIEFIVRCFNENEFGDSKIFAALYAGVAAYDVDVEKWYGFFSHVWEVAHGKVRRFVAVGVCAAYERWIDALRTELRGLDKERDADQIGGIYALISTIQKRIMGLRTVRRGNAVLTYASGNQAFEEDDIESLQINTAWWQARDPYLLGFENGVLDINEKRYTGKLRPGRPEDRLRYVLPCNWEGEDAPRPVLDLLLTGMFADRTPEQQQVMIAFLQRVLGGLGLTAKVILHALLILVGKKGRNGKDTLLTHMTHILGPLLAGPIEQACILKRPPASSGSASPHLAKLEGMLLAWVSEPERGERMDIGQLKMLIGGGDIPGRKNYKDSTSFPPTHQLILSCNDKPHADASDEALWPKVFPIALNMRYLLEAGEIKDKAHDRLADTTIPERLDKELAGSLAWLVAGSLSFQRNGLMVPAEVVAARNEYRGSEDTHQIFIDAQCTKGARKKYSVTGCYEDYKVWCITGKRKPMSDLRFGELMAEKGYTKKRYNIGMCYQGIAPGGTVGTGILRKRV